MSNTKVVRKKVLTWAMVTLIAIALLAGLTILSAEQVSAATKVKYTDGNSYVLTDDNHFIVKIDPEFKGYKVVYEAKFSESIGSPIYRNGYLFFYKEKDEKYSICRLSLKTGKTKDIYSVSDNIRLNSWEVMGDKIYIYCYRDNAKLDILMCNLDGSKLKKTSARNLDGMSSSMALYKNKIYMVCADNTYITKFYSMNKDGTGFKRNFSLQHKWCPGALIQFVKDGYIYYFTSSPRLKPDTQDGIYKVRINGTGRKVISKLRPDTIVTDGKNLVYPNTNGLNIINKAGKKSICKGLKGKDVIDLRNLYNGNLIADYNNESYIASFDGKKVYKVSDFSPENAFKDYVNGFNIVSVPTKTTYKVGETFDPSGFKGVYYSKFIGRLDELNKDSAAITFYTSRTVRLTEGRPFQQAGKKVVEIRYNGQKQATYTITVNN